MVVAIVEARGLSAQRSAIAAEAQVENRLDHIFILVVENSTNDLLVS
jgi:hypothetical protein